MRFSTSTAQFELSASSRQRDGSETVPSIWRHRTDQWRSKRTIGFCVYWAGIFWYSFPYYLQQSTYYLVWLGIALRVQVTREGVLKEDFFTECLAWRRLFHRAPNFVKPPTKRLRVGIWRPTHCSKMNQPTLGCKRVAFWGWRSQTKGWKTSWRNFSRTDSAWEEASEIIVIFRAWWDGRNSDFLFQRQIGHVFSHEEIVHGKTGNYLNRVAHLKALTFWVKKQLAGLEQGLSDQIFRRRSCFVLSKSQDASAEDLKARAHQQDRRFESLATGSGVRKEDRVLNRLLLRKAIAIRFEAIA